MKLIRILLIIILLDILSFQLIAQNQSPQISNVIFSQRTDGSFIVDINYDVNDPEGSLMTVSMQVSSDNGVTWDFSCNSITGDFGANITSGTLKHIEWDFGTEHSQTFGDQFRIKIIADDGTIVMNIPCPGMPTVPYEGITYNTVQIGTQCWLKENMNIGTRIDGVLNQTNNVPTNIIEKYCYNNLESNCDLYGGLYQWNEAMKYVTTPSVPGICPTGWHIPTLTEFETLKTAVNSDGNSLKAIGQGTGGGAGTNTSGFSALLAGYRFFDGRFLYLGYYTYFWSSSEYDAAYAYFLTLYYDDSYISLSNNRKDYGFSVRCVKDN